MLQSRVVAENLREMVVENDEFLFCCLDSFQQRKFVRVDDFGCFDSLKLSACSLILMKTERVGVVINEGAEPNL